jgi:hypothetical protein
VTKVRRLVKGCSHGRPIFLKRSYAPGYVPRHAKPGTDTASMPRLELAA